MFIRRALVILIFLSSVISSFAFLNSSNVLTSEEEDVFFHLYTRKNPLKEELFQLSNIERIKNSNFNANKKVKILIHGWKGSHMSSFGILIKNAFLIQYDANVIIVDWKRGAEKFWYKESRSKVPDVARAVAFMIDKIVNISNLDPSKIHIVGHSLGAHVAGVAGRNVNSGQIGRVTGLDPAGPLFSIEDRLRIGKHSAKFVDIIHTDAFSAGFSESLGHVDFYPNGGTAVQPGCGMDVGTLRSHRRAYWLFAESIITPGGFKAISCYNWMAFKLNACSPQSDITEMGEHVSKEARGSYYLITNDRTPFALGNVSLSGSFI